MNRVVHPWHKWECYRDGFYNDNTLTKEENEKLYMSYFDNTKKFERDMRKITRKWKHSCEHFLLNPTINRVAWIGQACVYVDRGVPRKYKYSYNMLSTEVKNRNNEAAKRFINEFQAQYTDKLHQQVEMLGVLV